MPKPDFVLTYPVAVVASVLAVCCTAILIVALVQGESIQAVLGAAGTLAAILGGLFAHNSVTPLKRPRVPKD